MKKLALLFLALPLMALDEEPAGSYKDHARRVVASEPSRQAMSRDCGSTLKESYGDFVKAARVHGSKEEKCADYLLGCGLMSLVLGTSFGGFSVAAVVSKDPHIIAGSVISGAMLLGGGAITHFIKRDVMFYPKNDKKTK